MGTSPFNAAEYGLDMVKILNDFRGWLQPEQYWARGLGAITSITTLATGKSCPERLAPAAHWLRLLVMHVSADTWWQMNDGFSWIETLFQILMHMIRDDHRNYCDMAGSDVLEGQELAEVLMSEHTTAFELKVTATNNYASVTPTHKRALQGPIPNSSEFVYIEAIRPIFPHGHNLIDRALEIPPHAMPHVRHYTKGKLEAILQSGIQPAANRRPTYQGYMPNAVHPTTGWETRANCYSSHTMAPLNGA